MWVWFCMSVLAVIAVVNCGQIYVCNSAIVSSRTISTPVTVDVEPVVGEYFSSIKDHDCIGIGSGSCNPFIVRLLIWKKFRSFDIGESHKGQTKINNEWVDDNNIFRYDDVYKPMREVIEKRVKK